MWTCSKCGEAIEDQFDSCWKCAAQPEQTSPLPEAPPLRWYHYVFALLMSYLVPWLAVFFKVILSSRFRHLLGSSDFSILLSMLVPAGITFPILFPFLRFPIGRRVALVGICAGWVYFIP